MRLQQQKRKNENIFAKRLKNFFFVVFVVFFIGICVLCCIGAGMLLEQKSYIEKIGSIEVPEATYIYGVDTDEETGTNKVIAKIYKENRTNVDLKDVPQNLQNAIIAIEDKRFYEHNGVDLRGVCRALVTNIMKGSYSQGASTISMQLARNVKLNSQKTLSRKIREILIAAQIEQTMSKEEILQAYLNSIYFGSGAFGVETASQVYFGKHVKDIDLSEAALIAGLPKAPSQYSPHKNYEQSIERRNVVLKAMYDEGFIDKNEYEQAKTEKIEIREKKAQSKQNYRYPQIINAVIEELKKHKFDEDQIYNGGLQVYTTIDTRIQDCEEKAVRDKMGAAHRRRPGIEAALISMDPYTGYIVAMCGSVDPKSEFNRCMQAKRQPGSVFKPIVYYTAIEQLGWGPETRISNERYSKDGWTPKNFDGRYGGHPTMKTAIANSINLPAIRAGEACGMDNVCSMAKRLGINSDLPPYLSTCIGAGNIKLVEMLQVFNVTANDGLIYTPTLIKKVYDTEKKNLLVDNTDRTPKRVMRTDIVKTMDSLLRNVVTHGTGRPVSGIKDARGKTGTNGKTDVSFAGYVPEGLSAMVWIGDDKFKPIPNSYSGGGTCGPIWSEFMKIALPLFKEDREKEKKEKYGDDKKSEKKKERREKSYYGNSDSDGQVIENTETEKTTGQEAGSVSETEEETYYDTEAEETLPEESDDDTMFVDVCPTSNKLPNPNCPSTVLKRFKTKNAPSSSCDIH
ncbi:MAG: PBP1A family penicillin-binding protein [Armatimonadetes bacterium]|nr:PBP1A family penicillin-binding protein [Candidatus Hippobium faecium]